MFKNEYAFIPFEGTINDAFFVNASTSGEAWSVFLDKSPDLDCEKFIKVRTFANFYDEWTGKHLFSKNVKIKAKRRRVYYWDFDFLNYRGERLLYCCVAPTFDLALQSFKRYTEFSPVTLLGCTISEPFEMMLQ